MLSPAIMQHRQMIASAAAAQVCPTKSFAARTIPVCLRPPQSPHQFRCQSWAILKSFTTSMTMAGRRLRAPRKRRYPQRPSAMCRRWLVWERSPFSRYAHGNGPGSLEEYVPDRAQRRFSFISMMGFTCTILITWEAELMWVTLCIWGT